MINFIKYRWLYLLISAIVIGSGLFSIFRWGFRYSIDFTGGSNFEFQTNKAIEKNQLLKILDKNKISVVDLKMTNKNVQLRSKAIDQKQESSLKKNLETDLKIKITV